MVFIVGFSVFLPEIAALENKDRFKLIYTAEFIDARAYCINSYGYARGALHDARKFLIFATPELLGSLLIV